MRALLHVRVSDGVVIDRTPLPLIWDGILASGDGSTVLAVGDMDELAENVRVIRVDLH